MLPFMKPKRVAGLIIEKRKPDAQPTSMESEDTGADDSALESAATDLIRAVHAKDVQATSSALRAAFDILDSEPHEEGPHTNEEDAQENNS